jgi:hypothetical protein
VEECEHVGFHRTLIEEGVELFINPQILNARYTEHTRYAAPILGPLLRVRNSTKAASRIEVTFN